MFVFGTLFLPRLFRVILVLAASLPHRQLDGLEDAGLALYAEVYQWADGVFFYFTVPTSLARN